MTYKEALFSDDTVSSIDHAFETGAAGKPHVEQSQKICLEIKKMVHLVQMVCHDRFRNTPILKVTTFKINCLLCGLHFACHLRDSDGKIPNSTLANLYRDIFCVLNDVSCKSLCIYN